MFGGPLPRLETAGWSVTIVPPRCSRTAPGALVTSGAVPELWPGPDAGRQAGSGDGSPSRGPSAGTSPAGSTTLLPIPIPVRLASSPPK